MSTLLRQIQYFTRPFSLIYLNRHLVVLCSKTCVVNFYVSFNYPKKYTSLSVLNCGCEVKGIGVF